MHFGPGCLRRQPYPILGMAFTEADLAAVEAALAKGEGYVQFGDRAVTYRSVEQLEAVRREIKRDLAAAAAGTTPRSRQTLVVGSKGF